MCQNEIFYERADENALIVFSTKKKNEGDLKCNLNIDKWLCGPWSGPLKYDISYLGLLGLVSILLD